jgi:inorganic pyrophosphatase
METTHPWHIAIGNRAPQVVTCYIEIPRGSNIKYELDKPTGLLKLDRVLYSAVFYPANYGFVPQTYFDDGDPLDILLICSIDLVPACIADGRVIGMMHMEDENGLDDKILAVADHDPAYMHVKDVSNLPDHTMNELKRFFQDYKVLEKKKVHVGSIYGKEPAWDSIRYSMEKYKQKFKIGI